MTTGMLFTALFALAAGPASGGTLIPTAEDAIKKQQDDIRLCQTQADRVAMEAKRKLKESADRAATAARELSQNLQ